ncbi:hypothetical protein FBX98_12034 [Burkholderia sp. SJZ115]|nr:hypothetical protein FB600_120112 [Burkholderia sp. SJZ089]TWC95731.1 hypothetical protein FBX98_12034 [Burkholderia sp. SJZ115]TWC99038.1 hypothetical protein FB601_11933 [Burkholderia sp. SJZ091]
MTRRMSKPAKRRPLVLPVTTVPPDRGLLTVVGPLARDRIDATVVQYPRRPDHHAPQCVCHRPSWRTRRRTAPVTACCCRRCGASVRGGNVHGAAVVAYRASRCAFESGISLDRPEFACLSVTGRAGWLSRSIQGHGAALDTPAQIAIQSGADHHHSHHRLPRSRTSCLFPVPVPAVRRPAFARTQTIRLDCPDRHHSTHVGACSAIQDDLRERRAVDRGEGT